MAPPGAVSGGYGLRKRRKTNDASGPGPMERLEAAVRSANRILVFSGSGLSANCGMSTFSTPGGLYERASRRYRLSDGKSLFTYSWYERNRRDALAFFCDVHDEAVRAAPGPGHRALAAMDALVRDGGVDQGKGEKGEKGAAGVGAAGEGGEWRGGAGAVGVDACAGHFLLRHYTMNVDGLSQSARVPPLATWCPDDRPWARLVELHGSVRELVCPECCERIAPTPAMLEALRNKRDLPCPRCLQEWKRQAKEGGVEEEKGSALGGVGATGAERGGDHHHQHLHLPPPSQAPVPPPLPANGAATSVRSEPKPAAGSPPAGFGSDRDVTDRDDHTVTAVCAGGGPQSASADPGSHLPELHASLHASPPPSLPLLRFRMMLYDDRESEAITPDEVVEQMEEDARSADLVLWIGISFQQSASTAYFRNVRRAMDERARAPPSTSPSAADRSPSPPSTAPPLHVLINPDQEAVWNLLTAAHNATGVDLLHVPLSGDKVLPRLVQVLQEQGWKEQEAGRAAEEEGEKVAPRHIEVHGEETEEEAGKEAQGAELVVGTAGNEEEVVVGAAGNEEEVAVGTAGNEGEGADTENEGDGADTEKAMTVAHLRSSSSLSSPPIETPPNVSSAHVPPFPTPPPSAHVSPTPSPPPSALPTRSPSPPPDPAPASPPWAAPRLYLREEVFPALAGTKLPSPPPHLLAGAAPKAAVPLGVPGPGAPAPAPSPPPSSHLSPPSTSSCSVVDLTLCSGSSAAAAPLSLTSFPPISGDSAIVLSSGCSGSGRASSQPPSVVIVSCRLASVTPPVSGAATQGALAGDDPPPAPKRETPQGPK